MTYYEYPCGCVASSPSIGQWHLVSICERHKAPPPLKELLHETSPPLEYLLERNKRTGEL